MANHNAIKQRSLADLSYCAYPDTVITIDTDPRQTMRVVTSGRITRTAGAG
ncbi:hypothetical protein PT300_12370 [Enterobacteriaceae bacterium ESL0689]|nr:hypothetical protein [Enterobacteriaceae bacterium ESL0689]